MYHDGEADALHIHQTLGQPGVISVCGDCQPVYLITTLAAELGVDVGGLYDAVRAHQVAVQQLGEPPAPPDVADAAEVPAGPHPAVTVNGSAVDWWGWCSCAAPGPHDQHGEQVGPDYLSQLREVTCDKCGSTLHGITTTIDDVVSEHAADHQDAERAEETAGQS